MCDRVGQDSGYGHEESHLMHDMKKFHIGLHFLNGMWFDVCMPLHVHYAGSSPCMRIFLLCIAHPVVGPHFRNRECTGRRRSYEVVIAKEADMWP